VTAEPVVDARGLRCPLPVIRLAQRATDCGPGTVLEVWATDPAARSDVPAWCRLRGHAFLDATERTGEEGPFTAYRVRLTGADRSPPAG
jgi:TusA-related sulfurtransferase